ncbi:hypothetical protein pb186bvf_015186 [Paramecium bursaria]
MDQYTREEQLLIKEIIEKGYDQDEFQEYVEKENPDKGTDLSLWDYDGLLQLIKNFQNMKSRESKIFQENVPSEDQMLDGFQIIDEDVLEQAQKNMEERITIVQYENYFSTIKFNQCLIDNKQNVEKKNTYLRKMLNFNLRLVGSSINQIQRPVEQSGGLLKFFKKTILFPLKTLPRNWNVHRSLEEFYQFRKILLLEFPEIIIPALPDVPIAENKMILDMSDDIIPHLNRFLKQVGSIKQFKTSKYFLTFLTETNAQNLNQQLNQTLFSKQYNVANKQIADGMVIVELSKKQFNDANTYSKFIGEDYQLIDEINRNLNKFETSLNESLIHLNRSIENIDQLKVKLAKQDIFVDYAFSLSTLNKSMRQYQTSILKDYQIFQQNIQKYFHIIDCQKPQLREFRQNLIDTYTQFTQEYILVEKKKEDLFNTKDPVRWKLDAAQKIDVSRAFNDYSYARQFILQQETKQVQQKQDNYVYMLNRFNEQMQDQIIKFGSVLKKTVNQFLQKYLEELHQNQIKWIDLQEDNE